MKETKDNKKSIGKEQENIEEQEFSFINGCTPDVDLGQITAEERYQEF